ncbi:7-cyano-7-deazaguanine synthase [Dyella acidiphila]|uniref:7-cyano-7-deazaguanine synthase n=1 Tax=Dyella acidiphila TaxID=2775866 RepID=A0ABR9GFH9_9GAMM|nr:7-cyano-7-deazaguanine synthase [Dyella acidiphila]MBE1162788.1 7-cyano-7-deazaguanine synthase [Dyella acidiphila]
MFDSYHVDGIFNRITITGDVCQNLRLNADGFFHALLVLPPPRCLDLLRIAAGIYTIDRITKRRRTADNELGMRRIRVCFAVDDLSFWQSDEVTKLLWNNIKILTEDAWEFSFVQRVHCADDLGHQSYLSIAPPPKHVALYSGGLDSAAGLAQRVLEGADSIMLITVAHQANIRGMAQRQIECLSDEICRLTGKKPALHHSTLSTSLIGGKAVRMRDQEKTQRTRAFFFCVTSAIAAHAYSLKSVEMYENGVGAINLPLMGGMLGSSLATRGAHPTFIRLVSELCTTVMGDQLTFHLPNIEKTKGEMLKSLAPWGLDDWIKSSRSCVHSSLRMTGLSHCGQCPACIERRQAFSVSGIADDSTGYGTDIFSTRDLEPNNADYFTFYKADAKRWLKSDPAVQRRLINHLRSTGISTNEDDAIIRLYLRHSEEIMQTFESSKTHPSRGTEGVK